MAKCASCGKMKCSCGGMPKRMKKMMGGMAMARPGAGTMKRPVMGAGSGPMVRPGVMVKPPMRRPMKKGGMAYGAGGGMGRMEKSMGGSVRRKGSCGKNN